MPLLLFLSHLICFPPASLSLPASQHPRQRQRRLLNLFDLASDVPLKWNNKGEKMCIRVCKVFHLLEVSARVCVCTCARLSAGFHHKSDTSTHLFTKKRWERALFISAPPLPLCLLSFFVLPLLSTNSSSSAPSCLSAPLLLLSSSD